MLATLGELVMYEQIFRALVRARGSRLPDDARRTRRARGSLIHQRAFIALVSERIVDLLEHIGTSSLIFVPTAKDFEAPELAPLLEVYGRGKNLGALDRAKLCRLAWELTADSFGGGHQLYERLHSGDPATIISAVYQRYDKDRGR